MRRRSRGTTWVEQVGAKPLPLFSSACSKAPERKKGLNPGESNDAKPRDCLNCQECTRGRAGSQLPRKTLSVFRFPTSAAKAELSKAAPAVTGAVRRQTGSTRNRPSPNDIFTENVASSPDTRDLQFRGPFWKNGLTNRFPAYQRQPRQTNNLAPLSSRFSN